MIQKNLKHTQVTNLTFKIPPGAPHHKVSAVRELKNDMTGYGMFSHMHLRGKDMTFRALYPDGRDETLLVVPNYNFDWQQAYRWARGQAEVSQGHQARSDRPLRQFAVQSLQSRSEEGRSKKASRRSRK